MSVHYCFGCDQYFDEDVDLECPRCGAPDEGADEVCVEPPLEDC